jgi:hypothetical protein
MKKFFVVTDVDKYNKKVLVCTDDIAFINSSPKVGFSVIHLYNSVKIACRENLDHFHYIVYPTEE